MMRIRYLQGLGLPFPNVVLCELNEVSVCHVAPGKEGSEDRTSEAIGDRLHHQWP